MERKFNILAALPFFAISFLILVTGIWIPFFYYANFHDSFIEGFPIYFVFPFIFLMLTVGSIFLGVQWGYKAGENSE